ncbi:cysteine synthase A [bacterium]|nr:MAG: cysteine synthase A [bacterium]
MLDSTEKISSLIGSTPFVPLRKIPTPECAGVFAKLEMFNPSGSVKDRPAWNMINKAEKKGLLGEKATVIEPTSGNTGIALAMLCALRDYRCILVMPENMSAERRKIMAAYGAEIVLTPSSEGIPGSIKKADELLAETPGSWGPKQFDNRANPEIHEKTTGPEIMAQARGKIDAFVAGIGTGGTITGVARALRKSNNRIKIIGVEPADSAVLSGKPASSHDIQGIGAGFIPSILDRKQINEIIGVETEEAIEMTRRLAREEGIFAGISSGAALAVAIKVARLFGPGKNVVTIFPDGGDRYLSTSMFGD